MKISYVDHNNKVYNDKCFMPNRDDTTYPMQLLKSELNKLGYEIHTVYITPIEQADIVLYAEIPNMLPLPKDIEKSYVILWESEMIIPRNHDKKNHKYFNKIFTWHDSYINNKKYIKLNYPYKIPISIPKDIKAKTKLATLIAGHKKSKYPKELYSKRIEAIRWFEKYHPEDFDFYGVGWDKYVSTSRIVNRIYNRTRPYSDKLYRMLKLDYSSYCGPVENKKATMTKYKFAICYENCGDIPGYITEKIFDCFIAGCVPIYGAGDGCKNNIYKYVPKECFIDISNFKNYEEMYSYITNISDEDYMKYLNAIEHFLLGDKGKPFSSETFVKTLIEHMISRSS